MINKILIQTIGFISKRKLANRFPAHLSAIVLLLFTPPVSSGEILTAELANEDHRLHEVHEPEVNVSGNVIVGVMSASACDALAGNALGIQSAGSGDKKICLRVTSRDGAYMSQNEYTVEVTGPTIINLPYQSGMQKVVDGYAEDRGAIAVTATIGGCERSARADYYLPAKIDHDSTTLETGTLSIYINGFDATDVFYHIMASGQDEPLDCDYIEEGRHTAYNFSCNIQGNVLSGPGPWEIEISREVYGRELKPIMIRLLSVR